MKPTPFQRNFKTRAEKISLDIRNQLKLGMTVACPARKVALLYNVTVTAVPALTPLLSHLEDEIADTVLARTHLNWLIDPGCGFSALAVIKNGYKMILYNANHSPARQESDIMHEMAHIICEHPGDCLQLNADLALRHYDEQYEAEAKWLGAVIQIPENGIFQLAKEGYSTEQIVEIYGCSLEMASYRRNVLAIDRRLSYIRQKRR